MNILTGVVLCIFALGYIAVRLLEGNGKMRMVRDIAVEIVGTSMIFAILLGGHWIGVILGKL